MVARGERLTGVPGKGQQALVPSFIGGGSDSDRENQELERSGRAFQILFQ